jgi:adenylate kinase
MSERGPNIIITGTPGTGKSSHAAMLAERLSDMTLMTMNEVAKERDCITGFDEERNSAIVDEDRLVDAIEDDLKKGGYIIDWHVCDIFPEDVIDLVIVLRSNTDKLYDRLKKRQYSQQKLDENLDVEIMQVILDDAQTAYDNNIVIELQSNEIEDMESNIDRIVAWKEQWEKDNQ